MIEAKALFYRDIRGETNFFHSAVKAKLPILLKGPTGCGKSRFVEAMAQEMNRPLVSVSCHEDTSASDLIGRFMVKGGDTIWQDGPATRAVRQGHILYLDEIAEARNDVIVVLHALTDYRRTLFLDRINEEVRAVDDFVFVASFNPGYQSTLREMKPSTRQRFVVIPFEFPSHDVECEILMAETSCSKDLAKRLVHFATKVRAHKQLLLRETISTRLLVHAARLVQEGLAPRIACDLALVQVLSDEAEHIAALRDLLSLCV